MANQLALLRENQWLRSPGHKALFHGRSRVILRKCHVRGPKDGPKNDVWQSTLAFVPLLPQTLVEQQTCYPIPTLKAAPKKTMAPIDKKEPKRNFPRPAIK